MTETTTTPTNTSDPMLSGAVTGTIAKRLWPSLGPAIARTAEATAHGAGFALSFFLVLLEGTDGGDM